MKNPYKEKSDNDLVSDAAHQGDTGNQAELTRRLMDSMRKLDISTAKYSSALIALTLVLIFLGFLQLILTIFVSPISTVEQFAVGAVFIIFIALAGHKISKAFLD